MLLKIRQFDYAEFFRLNQWTQLTLRVELFYDGVNECVLRSYMASFDCHYYVIDGFSSLSRSPIQEVFLYLKIRLK